MSTPETAGPNRDGSKSLARESKFGQAATFVTTTLALGAAQALGGLDISGLPQWAEATAYAAIGTVVGLLTAYATKNRKAARSSFGRDTL